MVDMRDNREIADLGKGLGDGSVFCAHDGAESRENEAFRQGGSGRGKGGFGGYLSRAMHLSGVGMAVRYWADTYPSIFVEFRACAMMWIKPAFTEASCETETHDPSRSCPFTALEPLGVERRLSAEAVTRK